MLTSPPTADELSPSVTVIDPLRPLVASPVLNAKAPLAPLDESPVSSDTSPLLPLDAVPVDAVIPPLTPVVPAFAVLTTTSPLLVDPP